MIGRFLVWALIMCVTPFIAMGGAEARTFDGITIIKLPDKAGWETITGHKAGPIDTLERIQYIVIFVSAQGSYAALQGGGHGCIAWAVPGSYTGSSITFGIPIDRFAHNIGIPPLCQPFTLRFEGLEVVRVEANNKVGGYGGGPQSADARYVRYNRKSKVVTQIPLIALNWGMAPFARHDIKGVRLGPVPVLKKAVGAKAKIKISRLRGMKNGNPHQDVAIRFGKQPGSDISVTVNGSIAVAKVTGWPWDALYGAWYHERLPQQSSREAFEQAVIDRYGQPSLRMTQKRFSKESLLWLYDLNGKQIGSNDAAQGNCLQTLGLWDTTGMAQNNTDFGPWGCALVMALTHNSPRVLKSGRKAKDRDVSEYRIEAISGYALALNHFLTRLERIRQIQEKIRKIQGYKPEL